MSRSSRWCTFPVIALAVLASLYWGAGQCCADRQMALQETQKSTRQRRQEANERLRELLNERKPQQPPEAPVVAVPAGTPTGINPLVDIALPNFANSPNIRKFVDSLPGLGPDGINDLQQYIPVAVADKLTYPGSDYYEIALVRYSRKMHKDLPATDLRGYVQLETPANAAVSKHIALNYPDGSPIMRNGVQVLAVDEPQYLGPLIFSQKNTPVRVKFTDFLPNSPNGDLPLPVDTTIMGAGMGPLGMSAMPMNYTQNRATLHLHGGLTPWISDGTPHQWVTPPGEATPYPIGVSVQNVPDMPNPGPGSINFYWTNQQSARLMFWHDHTYGITRLNVYAGEAAGYVLTDQVEEDLIAGTNVSGGNPTGKQFLPDLGGLYHNGIPLIIQDRTFVNDATTPPHSSFPPSATPTPPTSNVDPLWYRYVPGSTGGNLWFPHEYLPNENIYNSKGYNDMGRWDYGPWMIPPMIAKNNTLPSPCLIPEAFMDTAVVNGTAFPFVELPPTAVRFRILNACNDRMLNLQLYKADPAHPTEVKMVEACPNPAFPTWPEDGRPGGVPDPETAGPAWYQVGNEGGFLAKVAVIPPQPVDFDYNRRSVTFGGVTSTSLLLPSAVRADVVVDLSSYSDGDTLILYNDAPAPMPLYDTRYDYFTDDPDQTAIGGAPPTPEGFGPNTRTIMQIRIKGTATPPYDLAALQEALPKAFAVAQDHPLVPAAVYNAAYGTSYKDIYANSVDESLNITGATQSVLKVMLELPGLGYTKPPTVNFYGGGGSGAAAKASLNGVTGVTLVAGGRGYTSPPKVTISGGGGKGATASATVSGDTVTTITVTDPGSNYTAAPIVSIGGGGGTGATAQATVTLGSVGTITLTSPGSGYTSAPRVYLTGGGGTGATAAALVNGALVMNGKNLVEGMDMEFGRMNAVLGSTPNPLAPTVGAGPVIGAAFYIDPPTEILNAGDTVLWRISHIGVDSHSLHFHLFNVQVVNRVDWTNTIKPPYPDEVGWRETIRTNPFEDIIVALRPVAAEMKLPFGLPDSNRLLDPTMPAGSIGNFQPVLPPPGLPTVAQTTNVMTNFGWEYVWHCHILGHEENDMMRPLVLNVPRALPIAPILSGAVWGALVNLAWTDGTPVISPITPGNPANEIGFRIERATGTGAFAVIGTALANATTYTDTKPHPNGTYRYRVTAFNAAGNTASNIVTAGPPPLAPTNLTAAAGSGPRVNLTWRDNATNETGFVVERSANAGPFIQIATPGPRTGTGTTTYTDATVAYGNSYTYQVKAMNGLTPSGYSNQASVNVPTLPAAPSNLTASGIAGPTTGQVVLTWTDNATNETSFTVQRASNAGFTSNVVTVDNLPANTTTHTWTHVSRQKTFYFRVRAANPVGTSLWPNPCDLKTP